MPREVTFYHAQKKWDHYKQFYHAEYDLGIVQFETGELLVTRAQFKPYQRGRINKYGLSFHYPADTGFNYAMYHDDERVRKAWMHNSTYMVDHELQTVTRLNWMDNSHEHVPAHLARHSGFAYWGGGTRHWVSGEKLVYTKPVKLPKEEKAHLRELVTQCKAAQRLGAIPSPHDVPWNTPVGERGRLSSLGIVSHKIGLMMKFTEMTDFEKVAVATYGFMKIMMRVEADRLRIK